MRKLFLTYNQDILQNLKKREIKCKIFRTWLKNKNGQKIPNLYTRGAQTCF